MTNQRANERFNYTQYSHRVDKSVIEKIRTLHNKMTLTKNIKNLFKIFIVF